MKALTVHSGMPMNGGYNAPAAPLERMDSVGLPLRTIKALAVFR